MNANITMTNGLLKTLQGRLGQRALTVAVDEYLVGTWPNGCAAFWYVDESGAVTATRVGGEISGSRGEGAANGGWINGPVGDALRRGLGASRTHDCFFGEHLLPANPCMPIGVVRSERTALIAAVAFESVLWLAAGPGEALMLDRLHVLGRGRRITLYPDSDLVDKGRDAVEASDRHIGSIRLSDYVRRCAGRGSRSVCLGDLILHLHSGQGPASVHGPHGHEVYDER